MDRGKAKITALKVKADKRQGAPMKTIKGNTMPKSDMDKMSGMTKKMKAKGKGK